MTESTDNFSKPLPEWRLLKFDEQKVSMIRDYFDCSIYMARSLLSINLDNKNKIEEFLSFKIEKWVNEPVFPSMEKGANLLVDIIKKKKKICVHGDFDTDGIFSTVTLIMCLEACGCECVPYIPSRSEGHGLSLESLKKIKSMNVDVVISVDCGINAIEEAQFLKENNIDLIITDHHLPDAELPYALAIVNPQLDDQDEYKVLSGAGVSYRLGILLCNLLPPEMISKEKFLKFMINGHVCAAIATIADVVPLTGYNRILVSSALEKINHCDLIGLKKLCEISGLKGDIAAEDLAFQVIPRINAAQRMASEGLVWELLNCSDEVRIKEICRSLNDLNNQRKLLQKDHFEKILSKCKEKFSKTGIPEAIVICGDEWTEGISGLIASNLVENYHRPVSVILKKGEMGLASCRAPSNYHLKNALDQCSQHLITHGGHSGAAGFKIEINKEAEFSTAFECIMKEQRQNMVAEAQNPKVSIVSEVNLQMMNTAFVEEISRLEPFGKDNPKPLFAMRGLLIDGNVKYIGADKSHVIISFFKQGQTSVSTIGFGMAQDLREIDHYGRLDIVFTVGISKFNKKVQLQLKAVRQHKRK